MSDSEKIWYLLPLHFPSDRAHSIQVLNTCSALAGEGAEVRLMVQRNRKHPVSSIAEGLAYYGLEENEKFVIDWLPTHHKGWNGMTARWRIRRAKGAPYFYSRHHPLTVVAAKRARGVTVAELHKMEDLAKEPVRRAHGIVTITSPLADRIRKEWPTSGPVEVIPDAVDLAVFRPVSGASPPRVVYAGQFHDWKGVDILIRALARIPDVPALILGGRVGEDPRRDSLQKLAADLGLTERIEWGGFVPQREIPDRLRGGDIGVVPTRAANGQDIAASPLKLFEFMASGLPVVASDLPSIRDIIRDGENGLLFPEGDVDSLAAALKGLAADPARRSALGSRAQEEAKRHTWRSRAKRILAFLRSLRAGR